MASVCAEHTDDDLEPLVQTWIDSVGRQDATALGPMVAEDVIREGPFGCDSGHNEVIFIFELFFTAFPDLSLTVNLIVIAAPVTVVHDTATGTQAVPFLGAQPIGEPATWEGMYLLRLECGEIAEMWTEVDRLSQLGQGTSSTAPAADSSDPATPESCPE
jgi:predicted ester cyclase